MPKGLSGGQLQTNTKTSSSSKGDFQIQMNFRHRETRRRHVQINTHKAGDNEDSGQGRAERGELPDWQTANTGHVYWYTERNTARIT